METDALFPPDRRTRKRDAMRQGISDAATSLFVERGFDNVTVDQIAAAADVGRQTVFNHFPRKEDLFFDRDRADRQMLGDALRQRDSKVSPVETLRRLAHRLIAERYPSLRFNAASRRYVETIERSESLKARARAIRDELMQLLTQSLAECVGRDPADFDTHLAASLLMATWTAAFIQAHRVFRQSRNTGEANAAFLAVVDRGTVGVNAALAGTPYTRAV